MTRRKTGPDTATVELIEARSQGVCEACGEDRARPIHHRRPRRMGGTRRTDVNLPSNLLHISDSCHLHIETWRQWSLDRGLLLRDDDAPRREQVLYRGEWRYLDNAGGFEPPPTCPLGCAVWTSNNGCDCTEEAS